MNSGEPLIDPLPNSAGAGIRAGDNPDDGIRYDDFENVEDAGLNVAARFLLRVHGRKASLFRRVFDMSAMQTPMIERDSGRNPKEPAPMQWRNPDQAEKDKPGQKRRPEIVDPESAEIDHESEDAGEPSAFRWTEPGGIDLHHARARRTPGQYPSIPRITTKSQSNPQNDAIRK